MILILSEQNDITTYKVCEWLYNLSVPFLNIDNNINIINIIYINNNKKEIIFKYKGKQYSLDDFTVVWNRRGFFRFSMPSLSAFKENTKIEYKHFYEHLQNERKTLLGYISYEISEKFHIDDNRLYSLNKLVVLDIASKVGLKIPDSFITNNSKKLKFDKNNKYITKHVSKMLFAPSEKFYLDQGTKKVDEKLLRQEISCSYSFFQQQIEKKYEIRTFMFFDKLFSMAIFSQNNNKTKIDFRNYDKEKPNRMVPYNLPEEIEKKLLRIMKKLKIQSGSADLIFDGKDYVFLEINPVGQLDFVSSNCNYQIEKYIANFLKNKYHELEKNN